MPNLRWSDLSIPEQQKLLDERLRRVEHVTQFTQAHHDEPSAIAFGLLEIQRALHEINEAIPVLVSHEADDDRIRDTLTDIGDSLRDILHHIGDMRYFDYVLIDAPTTRTKPSPSSSATGRVEEGI